MRPIYESVLPIALALIVSSTASSQVVRRVVGPAAETATINELMAEVGLAEDGRSLTVLAAMPANDRGGDNKTVDLKSGDRIVALNGKLARTVADFQAGYEATPVGDTVEIGMQRGDRRWIERFTKADPASLPRVRRIQIEGNPEDIAMLMGLGVILSLQEAEMRVSALFPGGAGGELFREGDVLVSLNGKKDLKPADLQALWMTIPSGENADFSLRRDGELITFSLPKPEAPGGQRRVIRQ